MAERVADEFAVTRRLRGPPGFFRINDGNTI
jgi:hypothetical protein